jgi:hypothetical protein
MKEFVEKLIGKLEEEHEKCINRYGIVGGNAPASIMKRCIEIVKDLASEHNNGWISVEDALPEYTDDYNVTVGVCNELGYYECVKTFRFLKIKDKEPMWEIPQNDFCVYKVIAWQPLPAPYKKGE